VDRCGPRPRPALPLEPFDPRARAGPSGCSGARWRSTDPTPTPGCASGCCWKRSPAPCPPARTVFGRKTRRFRRKWGDVAPRPPPGAAPAPPPPRAPRRAQDRRDKPGAEEAFRTALSHAPRGAPRPPLCRTVVFVRSLHQGSLFAAASPAAPAAAARRPEPRRGPPPADPAAAALLARALHPPAPPGSLLDWGAAADGAPPPGLCSQPGASARGEEAEALYRRALAADGRHAPALAGLGALLLGHRPPPPRTKWTRHVPHPVLIGHAASLTPC